MDMTTSEQDLAATVTREMLEHRRPSNPEEERQVRQEAAQVAAEMIQAARAETGHDEEAGEELPETGYHARLRARLAREQAILDEESETDQDR